MVDLHTHSAASDGQLSPEALVETAFALGVRAIALTDHDTVSGLDCARKKAAELGIVFVAGIELNIEWKKGEFHLLGLGLKEISPQMEKFVAERESRRLERNEKIAAMMNDCGIKFDLQKFYGEMGIKSVGRPHFATFLAQSGYAKSAGLAFKKFLAPGAPFFAKIEGGNLDEAISAVKSCGGIACIAHPMSLYLSWGKFADILPELKSHGIRALEAWHPAARRVECERLEKIAHENGLACSAGSDFHGSRRPDRILGHYDEKTAFDDKYFFDEILPLICDKSS